MHGQNDQYSSMADVQYVRDGLRRSGHARALVSDLPGVDHMFVEASDTLSDAVAGVHPSTHFSREAAAQLATFTRAHL